MIASCGFLENELRQFSREEGVAMGDSVDFLGVNRERGSRSWEQKKKQEEESVGSDSRSSRRIKPFERVM